ncbi:hypothetical protein HPB52_013346 [Rhipicephalus sanguineus]|uniref:Uncharacterized protein n=1 Tax=Rhipicephalus sanguineus TaxID=34632 RepID=A0A9D4PEK2_RHISA|nr:hypothetical protein HPB52_013346 [Rhipicephalus sanguineus]
MTAQDMDALFQLVSMATDSQLHSLDNVNFRWLPYMKGRRSTTMAVRALRKAVEKCPVRQTRLERLVFFYCWLTPLQLLRPWTLMRFSVSAAAGASSHMQLLEGIETAMKILGLKTTSTGTHTVTSVHGCVMVEDTEPRAPAHVVCLYLWRFLPYLAVYAPTEKIHSELSVVLAALMDCDPAHLVCGIYEDLDSALTAALLDGMNSTCDSPMRNAEKRLRDMSLQVAPLQRIGNEMNLM